MSETSDRVRKQFKEGDDIRDAGLQTPDDIQRFDDIVYGKDPKWQILDVYRPKNVGGSLPVIVSVHGGGWVYGDKDRYQYYCMSLAEHGFAVVNFTYRLAPEFKFPAPVEDTLLVFQWLHSHAEEYGFDTSHVFAVGDSAGAHILAIFCCLCANPEYAAKYTFPEQDGVSAEELPCFTPTAIALNCGVYQVKIDGQEDLNTMLMADFLPGKGTPEEIDLINPIRHVTEAFPPAWVMTCDGDFLKEQAPTMARALLDHNIPFRFAYYRNKDFALGHVFHCNMKLPDAARCNKDECDFFRSLVE